MRHKTMAARSVQIALVVSMVVGSLFWRGDAHAESHVDAALDQEIERAKAKQDRVLKSCARRNDKRAISVFAEQERQRAERDNTPIKNWLAGRALHIAKQKLPAHQYLRRAWNADRRLWPAGLRLGLLYLEDNRHADALKYIDRILRLRPQEDTALRMKIECHLKLEQWAAAIPPLLSLYRKEPDSIQVWEALARCYQNLGQFERAIEWLERLRKSRVVAGDPSVAARLADCYGQLERWPEARAMLDALRGTPIWEPNPQVQKQLIMVLFRLQDTPALETELRQYVARVPDDVRMQELFVLLLLRKDDLDGALAVARIVQSKQTDPKLRDVADNQILMILLRKEAFSEALTQARSMRAQARDAERAAALDSEILMLLLRLKDLEGALAHGKAMRKAETDPQRQNALDEMIRRLKAGEDPMNPVKRANADPDNPFVKLVKRCIDKDVATRRQALREYFELNLPLVDPIIYQRFSPEIESDPECRIWVIRILGRFDMVSMSEPEYAREVAKRLAESLEDPVAEVRVIGAEELGGLGVSAGLIYLMPHLWRVDLDGKPADTEDRKRREREYNAVRKAIVRLSGHNDLSVIDEDWIAFDKAKANREHWNKHLDSTAATPAKLKALADLETLKMEGQEGPRAAWFLRFCLDHCFRPSQWPVAKTAYQLLRDARQPQAQGAYGKLWKDFPVLEDSQLIEANRGELERRIKVWWRVVSDKPASGGRAAPDKTPPAPAPEPAPGPEDAPAKGDGAGKPK